MTLVEKGLVSINDPVSKFFPEIPNLVVTKVNEDGTYETRPVKTPMTFVHLLTHTSGLNAGLVGEIRKAERKKSESTQPVLQNIKPNGQHTGGGGTDRKYLSEEMFNLVRYPLGFDPGTEWSYHISTNMLAYMIERISGKTLREYVKETVLIPLGMNETDWFYKPEALARFVKPCSAVDSKLIPGSTRSAEGAVSVEQTYCEGALGLNGPIEDYAKFCQMLLNKGEFNGHRILKPETVELMTTINYLPEIHAGGKGEKFGLGFRLYNEITEPIPAISNTAYAWGGALGTSYTIDPQYDLIVLYYTNMTRQESSHSMFLSKVYRLFNN